MAIKKSAEDYLETMLILREEKGYIRSIDIAEHLGVTKPSVSYATKHLRESGHITMDRDGMIKLTATGMAVATKIY
jgi:Mn-dependent DtxR family transcriptional regulator